MTDQPNPEVLPWMVTYAKEIAEARYGISPDDENFNDVASQIALEVAAQYSCMLTLPFGGFGA